MQTRPYAPGDEDAIADLWNAADAIYGVEPFFTAASIRSDMGGWIKDPERDTRLCHDADGVLVGWAMVAPPPPDGTRAQAHGAVLPERQGHGIGRELKAWQFDRLREMHAEHAPGRAWDVESGGSEEDTGLAGLCTRFGMTPVRYFFEMKAKLPATGEPAPVPDGLRLVPYGTDLAVRVYEANAEAFADHWGFEKDPYEDFAKSHYESETFRPDLSRIALDGDEVAAYLLAFDGVPGDLQVGLVGTRRPWRKRGLASALLSASMAAGTADGKRIATLGVDADSPTGAVGVYERAGFVRVHTFVTYRGPLH